ncbi:MAG: hypothetical protein GF346_13405 [Candidatus Eisenbacteria bacterium]|nr:hypothetical protein [Candidatus Latescibacterota bacterium]MBD3303437.1 hypothetical protein [Candidatus Eisenbacteria bacterium]
MPPTNRTKRARNVAGPLGVMLLFAVVLLINAWVVDDAYITFRVVDNLLNGHGLTWNVSERVQAYTHPLWMFFVTGAVAFTSEFFFTAIVLSCVLTLAALLLAWVLVTRGFREDHWRGYLLVVAILSSKAILDYASSGLENSLSYLIAAVFVVRVLRMDEDEGASERGLTGAVLLASLAFVNRQDTLLLYVPALVYLLLSTRVVSGWRRVRAVLVGTIPATGWLLFALFYYGSPFPNTAYAKVLATGFPLSWRIERGLEYLWNSISWDTAAYVVLGFGLYFAVRRLPRAAIAIIAGVLLYMLFVVLSAASATHLSGRFFAVPLFVATVLFVKGVPSRRFGVAALVILVAYMGWSPISAIKFGTPLYRPYAQNPSYIDAKWYVVNEGAGLLAWRPGIEMPDHDWYRYGKRIRSRPGRVHVGGAYGSEPIGYAGFAAGPGKHLVDKVGLSDPLLARLPAIQPDRIEDWKSGHFHRRIPAGYVESLRARENRIRNPGIRRYYEVVYAATRDPIFARARLEAVLKMNFGRDAEFP